MRLDKLTIGSAKNSPRHQFKNLKDVTIDFDQNHWVTVVIGWNGTGKSNVLEALAIIFRDLILKKREPEFSFRLIYRMGVGAHQRQILIDADPDRKGELYQIYVATSSQSKKRQSAVSHSQSQVESIGEKISLSSFLASDMNYMPRYVFGYYSGESGRLQAVFSPYLENYDAKLRNGIDPGLKRFFYAMPIHSQFVLLAFLINQSAEVRTFLDKHLGLDPDEGIESVLFVLREPPWKSKATDGDPRFWNARGVVSQFLSRLMEGSLAPITVSRRVATSLWNTETLQFKYFYIKGIDELRRLVGRQSPAQFFRDLESTHVSELIEEVRIRIRLKKNDGSVIFRELSEGEQQLLTVLGLMRFTSEEESLFLLDEPDTHLNPRWCVDYFHYLQMFIGASSKDRNSSHVVLTTHNPLAIAELVRQQVQILNREESGRRITATTPALDPRGMGYAGIVTSDMFGLSAALDSHTQALLEEKRVLSLKKSLLKKDRERLEVINNKLEGYGFRFSMRDPLFEEYLKARYASDKQEPVKKTMSQLPSAERSKKAKVLIEKVAKKLGKETGGRRNASNRSKQNKAR